MQPNRSYPQKIITPYIYQEKFYAHARARARTRAHARGRDTGDMRTAPNRGPSSYPRHMVGRSWRTVAVCRGPISGYHGTVTRDRARASGDVWYNGRLPLSTRIDTLCMWHQSRIGARPMFRPRAQCGARHAPRRGPEGGGARPQARRSPGGPSAGRAVPRAGPTRTNTRRRTQPGRARPAARPRGRGRTPSRTKRAF